MNESDAISALLGKTAPPRTEPVPAPAPPPAPVGPEHSAMRFWSVIGLGTIACAAWIYGSVAWLDRAIVSGRFGAQLSNGQIDVAANLIVFSGLLTLALLLCRLTRIAAQPAAMAAPLALLTGLSLGSAGVLLALLQAWLGNHVVAGEAAHPAGLGPVVLASLTTLFGSAVEEVTFRGWLQRRLADRIGPAGAVIAGAMAFSALHVFGGSRTPFSLLNIFLAGLLFGLLLLRTGSLWAAIGAHFAWNWTEVDLLGLHPNPGASPSGSIFDLDLVGASLWGGSAEGLNASLPVSVVMLALILPLLVPAQRQPVAAPA